MFLLNFLIKYQNLFSLTDELHALAIGRKIVRNLHLAGIFNRSSGMSTREEVREPIYSPEELRGIVPVDPRKSYDIRSVIARIVDGSEFDEFKKLYGPVSFWPGGGTCRFYLFACNVWSGLIWASLCLNPIPTSSFVVFQPLTWWHVVIFWAINLHLMWLLQSLCILYQFVCVFYTDNF